MTEDAPTTHARVPETLDPAYYEALGRAIKVARAELGLSRKDLAEAARISYPYVADIESGRGRPSSSALLAVARALGMSPSTLMARAESFVHRMREPNTAAESPAARPAQSSHSWFRGDTHARGRATSSMPEMEEPLPEGRAGREELHRLIEELPDEDVPLALELARRLLGGLPTRPS